MLIDTNSPFYAAVAIGSTKVTGMVGRVDSEGAVNALSYVAVSSADFIRKGRVYNVDKMTQCLKNIRKRLEDQINCDIKQVYVALNCQGMRSITHIEERTFPQRITVQQELIESLKADLPIVRHTMAADRLANVMTDEKERSTGCAFVEMGSETTTVAVYRGKLLRHFAVLPLGGLNITRDIASIFNCEESEAEEFKRTYGYPESTRMEDNGEVIHLRDGGRARPLTELYDIIEARTAEIVQNVKAQIEYAGFDSDTLVNGLYITGGAAQLPHLNAAFAQYFPNWNIHFDRLPSALNVRSHESLFNENAIYNVVLSVIRNAEVNCNAGVRPRGKDEPELFVEELTPAEPTPQQPTPAAVQPEPQQPEAPQPVPQPEVEEEPEEKKEKKKSKFFSSLKSFFNNIVTDDE